MGCNPAADYRHHAGGWPAEAATRSALRRGAPTTGAA